MGQSESGYLKIEDAKESLTLNAKVNKVGYDKLQVEDNEIEMEKEKEEKEEKSASTNPSHQEPTTDESTLPNTNPFDTPVSVKKITTNPFEDQSSFDDSDWEDNNPFKGNGTTNTQPGVDRD
uniref:Uncharacterized protein n=1 Tax=Capitella teleta TaxID=283909 RepID=X2A910_CAPTE